MDLQEWYGQFGDLLLDPEHLQVVVEFEFTVAVDLSVLDHRIYTQGCSVGDVAGVRELTLEGDAVIHEGLHLLPQLCVKVEVDLEDVGLN